MADLIENIDDFRAKYELSEWQFGELALNDRHFVRQLRDGRDLRMSTLRKVQDFMAAYVPVGTSSLSS